MKLRIAIVEDDREISRILRDLLESSGYETVQIYDGQEASKLLECERFDLVLLDLMLPRRTGEQIIAELRRTSQTPVIVISAKSMKDTKLEVLRLGADDYLIKPFDLDEVLVRIEVVLRRCGTLVQEPVIEFGSIMFHTGENRVTVGDADLSLTAKELMMLRLLLEHPQKVYTKAELYEAVWNEPYYYENNTINVHVSNLRSKLKKATGNDCIETVWGIGYKLKGA